MEVMQIDKPTAISALSTANWNIDAAVQNLH